MRMKINEATRLTCSAGIACNKMLAKICTDMNKPNGQTYLKPDKEEVMKFIEALPIRKIPFIGRMSELSLQGLGIYKCKDIIEKAGEIYVTQSERNFHFLIRSALGIARCIHEEEDDDIQKSISIRSTFEKPIKTYE